MSRIWCEFKWVFPKIIIGKINTVGSLLWCISIFCAMWITGIELAATPVGFISKSTRPDVFGCLTEHLHCFLNRRDRQLWTPLLVPGLESAISLYGSGNDFYSCRGNTIEARGSWEIAVKPRQAVPNRVRLRSHLESVWTRFTFIVLESDTITLNTLSSSWREI
jgi:hypothetical protein